MKRNIGSYGLSRSIFIIINTIFVLYIITMKTWLFNEKSYKKILIRLIEESQSSRGMVSRVAEAIGCQRSYLSQVLHSKVQLTKEQAWSVCVFFGLSPEETRFFECLVDHERAASPAYRAHLEAKMGDIRREAEQLSKQVAKSTGFNEAEALFYFSHWLPCAAHVLSSIAEFQDPAKMAARLSVPLPSLMQTLSALQAMGLVKQQKGRWVYAGGSKWVKKESLLVTFHHQNWRQLAFEDSRNLHSEGLHYTMVQTISKKDYEVLKAMILDFIGKSNKIAEPSAPEALTCMNIDFFQPRT